jgi:hypothetical protein
MLRSKNALATDQVFVAILITSAVSIGLFVLVHCSSGWRCPGTTPVSGQSSGKESRGFSGKMSDQ